ncbi:transposase [Colletotrichum incanum]|uniref:Transposase n=1 Tax=Colletotrichum incanum TaxID=1573173 RepID=A0A167DFI4_COLIC|nr:transposase [Colletotrichum incanum]
MEAELAAFCTDISGNRSSNDELSEVQRVAITALVLSGRTYRDVAALFNCSANASGLQKLTTDWEKVISLRTLKRVLKSANYRKWRAMKRPFITKEAALKRLQFAREWIEKVEELMMDGKSELVFLERDDTSEKKGYSSNSYIECLKKGYLPNQDDTRHFIQDNAPIHSSAKTTEWLLNQGISWLEWPPYSPDLNPIEHCWRMMKSNLRKLYPEAFHLKKNEIDIGIFKEKIKAAWEAIPQEKIRALIKSLPQRLAAVIRARGWYTRY